MAPVRQAAYAYFSASDPPLSGGPLQMLVGEACQRLSRPTGSWGDENDERDAGANAASVQRPTMRFVPLKSTE